MMFASTSSSPSAVNSSDRVELQRLVEHATATTSETETNSHNDHNNNNSNNNSNDNDDIEQAKALRYVAKPVVEDTSSSTTTSSSKQTSNTTAILACSLYSFCSVSMVLVNKSLASSYSHLVDGNLNIFLVVFQAVVAVLCVQFSKFMNWVDYPPLTLRTFRSWAPVNIFFCLMLFTGMASLQTNSVPMVTVFKNVTNILTATGDYLCFGNKPEKLVLAAFGVMLLGATAAAWQDTYITYTGLFWMAANCFSTAGYVLYMKYATQHVHISKFGMVLVNNVLCVAFLLPAALAMGQVQLVFETPAIHTTGYFLKNVFAGFVGFFLNFASLQCVAATGPTTYAIVGSVNKVPVALLGYLLFDNVISGQTWFFIGISILGGWLFSFAKIQSVRAVKKVAA